MNLNLLIHSYILFIDLTVKGYSRIELIKRRLYTV